MKYVIITIRCELNIKWMIVGFPNIIWARCNIHTFRKQTQKTSIFLSWNFGRRFAFVLRRSFPAVPILRKPVASLRMRNQEEKLIEDNRVLQIATRPGRIYMTDD